MITEKSLFSCFMLATSQVDVQQIPPCLRSGTHQDWFTKVKVLQKSAESTATNQHLRDRVECGWRLEQQGWGARSALWFFFEWQFWKKKKQPMIFTWSNSLKCEVWPTVAQRPQVWIDGWCCWFLNISVASFHFFFTGSCNKSHGETWLPQDHSCCHWCSVKPLLSLKGSL